MHCDVYHHNCLQFYVMTSCLKNCKNLEIWRMEFDSCGENVNELTKSLKSVWRKSYYEKLFIADLVFGVIRLLTSSIDG